MRLSLEAGIAAIRRYVAGSITSPFFVGIDGTQEIRSVIQSLPENYRSIYVSSYCKKNSFPDYDRLWDDIQKADSNILLHGFGECAMLSADSGFVRRLKDKTYAHKLIVIYRNAGSMLTCLQREDSKFSAMRWCEIISMLDIAVVQVQPPLALVAFDGLKALLEHLEGYEPGKSYVRTDLQLENVAVLSGAYAAIRDRQPSFAIAEAHLSSDQWEEYLKDDMLDGFALEHWRTYLRMLIYGTESPYLRLVMKCSDDYVSYSECLYSAILHVAHTADDFRDLYEERKALLQHYPAHEIEAYIVRSRAKDLDRIYYLTDNTRAEKRAIIEALAHIKLVPDELPLIYPDLADYLSLYRFKGEKGALFTDYFQQYKQQKVFNEVQPEFLAQVIELSKTGNRQYNTLDSRGKLLMKIKSATKVPSNQMGLFWLDALGVEYLGFIQKKARVLGLRLSTHVGQASLPTLTSFNRGFYDDWSGFKAPKEVNLDNLKHDGCGIGTKNIDPALHLADELDVISGCLIQIKKLLIEHRAEKMLLVSDHGASRLCVLNQRENKWTMSEKGKYSGRCCPINDADECPESATEAENLWVLANYDRFKGGRAANVEVHGGATLEEVVIPAIEIELFTKKIDCYVPDAADPAIIIKPLDDPPVIPLFCSNAAASISVQIKGREFVGRQDSANKNMFRIALEGHWSVGTVFTATVFDGDNELSTFRFILQRETRATLKDRDGSEFFGS